DRQAAELGAWIERPRDPVHEGIADPEAAEPELTPVGGDGDLPRSGQDAYARLGPRAEAGHARLRGPVAELHAHSCELSLVVYPPLHIGREHHQGLEGHGADVERLEHAALEDLDRIDDQIQDRYPDVAHAERQPVLARELAD